MLSRKLAITVVVVVGLSITALELAAARLVAPFFGSTIFVWGSAIGVALAALALGYWFGGKIADTNPSRGVLSLIITFAGLCAAIIPLVFRPVVSFIETVGRNFDVPIGVLALVAMCVLFLLPVMALGAVSPYTLRLSLKSVHESGRWSGVLSGFSTLGSIAGTFLAAFYSIPELGTRVTIVIASVSLLLLGAVVSPLNAKRKILPIVVLVPLLWGGTAGAFFPRRGLVWEKESPYQLIQVIRGKDQYYLLTDAGRGLQSVYRPGSPYTGYFYDAFGSLPFLAEGDGRQRSVLILGLGGASMARLYREVLADAFAFDITGVEIDPGIVEAARLYFDLDRLGVRVVVDDARTFLRSTTQQFDIIIVDAYIHELQIPPILATKEFFEEVSARLAPGGVVGMNVVVGPRSKFFPTLVRTVAAAFPAVYAGPFNAGASNHFVIAGDAVRLDRIPQNITQEIDRFTATVRPLLRRSEQGNGEVFTDDQTNIELLL